MTLEVPLIDITPYVHDGSAAERAAVAAALDDACRHVGFMQIVGHGIPQPITAGLADAMDPFFGLPLEQKKNHRGPAGSNRGYSAPKSESLSLSLGVESASRMNDFFEAYNVGVAASEHPGLELSASDYAENLWPTEVSGFQAQVEAYFVEAGRVARTLTRIFADALGLAPDFFDAFTDHSIDVLRMNNYALPPGTVDLDGDPSTGSGEPPTGMGEHTDFGIVTVLWADQVRGLQVLGGDGSWNDVSPADGALLVNLGDLTARWTNERWLSTLHRVKPPIINGTIQRRRSAAYFHDGNADAVISTIPGCIEPGADNLYTPVTPDGVRLQQNRTPKMLPASESSPRDAARVRAAV